MRAACNIIQWRTKFVNECQAIRAAVRNLIIAVAGGALFRHFATDDTWQANPLQDALSRLCASLDETHESFWEMR